MIVWNSYLLVNTVDSSNSCLLLLFLPLGCSTGCCSAGGVARITSWGGEACSAIKEKPYTDRQNKVDLSLYPITKILHLPNAMCELKLSGAWLDAAELNGSSWCRDGIDCPSEINLSSATGVGISLSLTSCRSARSRVPSGSILSFPRSGQGEMLWTASRLISISGISSGQLSSWIPSLATGGEGRML